MKKYEINNDTLAVVGVNENTSKVLEKNKKYLINDKSYNVMEDACNYFGSSYKGRVEGTKKMIGVNYKVPIIIEESSDLIFFPLDNIENEKCIWISLKWFDKVVNTNGKTYILFRNGTKILINNSKYSVENQVYRATKLNYLLNSRKKSKNS